MLVWIGLLACWLADKTAGSVVRERPYYRPVALLLSANVVAELTRLCIRIEQQGKPRPYTGLARLLFHVEQAAGLVWPWGVVAVALVVLARRSPLPALCGGVLALAVHVAAYPWLRGDRLAVALLLEQVVVVAFCAWAFVVFWRSRPVERLPGPWLMPHHKAAIAVATAETWMLAGPHFIGFGTPNPYRWWWLAQIGYSILFAYLAIMQRRWRWTPSSGTASS